MTDDELMTRLRQIHQQIEALPMDDLLLLLRRKKAFIQTPPEGMTFGEFRAQLNERATEVTLIETILGLQHVLTSGVVQRAIT